VPPVATGEALAASLGPLVRGLAVLVPRAEEGRPELVDGLRAAGAEVAAPPAYRTAPAPPEALAPLGALLEREGADAVAFASPSAVAAVVSALGERRGLLARVALAAIGPTTSAALRQAGFPAAVESARHTGWDLAEAIAAFLGPR
jgi:uroporphyrinogen-III synthase